jgi:hypothetical protein
MWTPDEVDSMGGDYDEARRASAEATDPDALPTPDAPTKRGGYRYPTAAQIAMETAAHRRRLIAAGHQPPTA